LDTKLKLWAELVDGCEELLIAGLRERVGPHGDWQAAYREWYARKMDDHERAQIQFLENLSHREAAYRDRRDSGNTQANSN
jgi:hypothetical protein